MGVPVVVGLVLALLAGSRYWTPSLAMALGVGAVLRVTVMAVAVHDPAQPWDLAMDFPAAADAVRQGQDPALAIDDNRWHFLPLMAYVLAFQKEAGELVGLSWGVSGRIVPVLADLALIPLVARLADERPELRGFQYACAPVGLMVSAIHGQFGPLSLLFGVAALLAARHGRTIWAGVLAGLAVTAASWMGLLVPGVLLAVPSLRQRLTVLAGTAAVPLAFLLSSALFLNTTLAQLPDVLAAAVTARPVVGNWGWTAVVTGGRQEVSDLLGAVGTPVLAVAVLTAWWWWRRAHPADLTLALVLTFLIVTYRFGPQYLLWPMPFLIARPPRWAVPAVVVTGIWAGFAYLHLLVWPNAVLWWTLSSLVVIAVLIRTLPPREWAGVTVPASTAVVLKRARRPGHEHP
jgi:hypothetical protein